MRLKKDDTIEKIREKTSHFIAVTLIKPHLLTARERQKRQLDLSFCGEIIHTWNEMVDIHLFGSNRLGVNLKSSDIDVCLISNVSRCAFVDLYNLFVEKLKNTNNTCCIILNTFVPVIKLCINSTAIDLVYSSKNTKNIQCMRSLNGVKVSEAILTLIPNKSAFLTTLRFIKLWAQHNNIHNTIFGYFGGIAWMILVAFICVNSPNVRQPSQLICMFFHVFAKWNWSLSPVYITKTWQDVGSQQNAEAIILTPIESTQNAAYAVTKFALKNITIALRHSASLLYHKQPPSNEAFGKLLQNKSIIETRPYNYHLKLEIFENTFADIGCVDARIKQLIISLQNVPSIRLVHVFKKPTSTTWVLGIFLRKLLNKKQIDLTNIILSFIKSCKNVHFKSVTINRL